MFCAICSFSRVWQNIFFQVPALKLIGFHTIEHCCVFKPNTTGPAGEPLRSSWPTRLDLCEYFYEARACVCSKQNKPILTDSFRPDSESMRDGSVRYDIMSYK